MGVVAWPRSLSGIVWHASLVSIVPVSTIAESLEGSRLLPYVDLLWLLALSSVILLVEVLLKLLMRPGVHLKLLLPQVARVPSDQIRIEAP